MQTVLPLGDRSPEPWSSAAVPDSVRAPPGIAAIRSVNGCANSSRKAWLDEAVGGLRKTHYCGRRRMQMHAYSVAAAYNLLQMARMALAPA